MEKRDDTQDARRYRFLLVLAMQGRLDDFVGLEMLDQLADYPAEMDAIIDRAIPSDQWAG